MVEEFYNGTQALAVSLYIDPWGKGEEEKINARADELLPGVEDAKKYKASELIQEFEL